MSNPQSEYILWVVDNPVNALGYPLNRDGTLHVGPPIPTKQMHELKEKGLIEFVCVNEPGAQPEPGVIINVETWDRSFVYRRKQYGWGEVMAMQCAPTKLELALEWLTANGFMRDVGSIGILKKGNGEITVTIPFELLKANMACPHCGPKCDLAG